MADDISKKITIDVEVNTDGLQQINQYQTAINNLTTAVKALGKPLTDATTTINNTLAIVSDKEVKTNKATQDQTLADKQKANEASAKTTIGIALQTAAQLFNISKILNKKKGDLDAEAAAKQLKTELDNAQKISDSVFTIVTKGIEQQSDAKVRALDKDQADELKRDGTSTAAQATTKQKYARLEYQVKLKAFKEEQKVNIAQAIMNGAIAITKTEADLGPIAGTLALGAIVAQTAAQVATIERQQPPQNPYAKGGYFKSDGKGAILPGYSRTDNTNPTSVRVKP